MTRQDGLADRLDYMDIFRGFGIILMMMGHITFGSKFDFFIHAFHMPMFFVISGFFFQSKKGCTLTSFILKKSKTLLVPYIVFGLFHYIIYLLLYPDTSPTSPLIHLLFINTVGLPLAGALWFLTALFFADVLYFLIDRYITNEDAKWITIIVIAGFGNCVGNILPFTLPYAMGASMVGIGLFQMGYLLRKYENAKFMKHILNMPFYEWLILAVATVLLIFQNGYINMREETYDGVLLFWINTVLAVIIGINFSKLIYRLIHDTYICKWLCSIGRDSIVYVCLNQLVIMLIMNYISTILESWLLSRIIVLCLSLLILLILSLLFTKTKLKLLIGK